ncbi:coiled-coil domain-containing protein [Brevibacillus migulae]|uniref:coiled-coil domain-containing protein n=1 Tax=Brevibacillus migulae TaxID=1644114 RepID=UPI00106DDAD2|nr:hypothetical protein [Brevibacillus migulae]
MRRFVMIMLVFLLSLSSVSSIVGAVEPAPPLEELILQQHLTQKELERSLSLVKEEEKALQTEIAQLTLDMGKQASIIAAMRKHAGEVARAYYMGERTSLLSLIFDTENFNDFLLLYEFLQLLYERDLNTLERFQQERAKLEQMQATKQNRLSRVTELRKHFESQLQQLLIVQAEKERNLNKLSDPAGVESLMDHLIVDWRERGLPAFNTFFSELAAAMFQVQELATPERISSEDLFSHTLTISEEDFNQFLMSKNDLFKQSRFTFENDQLMVEGSYDQMNLRIVGNYEYVSPQELKFHITKLTFDGFELPQTTIEEMEKKYDLGFYPSVISPNVQVQSIRLADQALTLKLKLNFPFGFGKK